MLKSHFFSFIFLFSLSSIISCKDDGVGLIADAYDPYLPIRDYNCLCIKPDPSFNAQPLEYQRGEIEFSSEAKRLGQFDFKSLSFDEKETLDLIDDHLLSTLTGEEINYWSQLGEGVIDSITNGRPSFIDLSQKIHVLFAADEILDLFQLNIIPAKFYPSEVELNEVTIDTLLTVTPIDTTGSRCAMTWYVWALLQVESYYQYYSNERYLLDSIFGTEVLKTQELKALFEDSIENDYQYQLQEISNYWSYLNNEIIQNHASLSGQYEILLAFNNALIVSNYYSILQIRSEALEQLEEVIDNRKAFLGSEYDQFLYELIGQYNNAINMIDSTMLDKSKDCR